MDQTDALECSESLVQIGEGWWRQIPWAYRQRVHEALGMSRPEWAERYHGYLRMEIPERRAAVAELTAEGFSQREIGDVLGVDETTVRRDVSAAFAAPHTCHQAPPEKPLAANAAPPAYDVAPEPASRAWRGSRAEAGAR